MNNRFSILILAAAVLLFSWAMTPLAVAGSYEAIEIVQTRPDVTVRLMVFKGNSRSSTALLLFPGADGTKQFGEKDGRFWVGNNFLLRSARELAMAGFIVVAVDAPSDQSQGMPDSFRTSPRHAKDIRKVISYLKEKHRFTSLYLVGTSKGTLSAAYLAAVLDEPALEGTILTAVYPPSGYSAFDLTDIDDPVLIIHHLYDECRVTPVQGAFELKQRLTESPRVDIVVVTGGSIAASSPCNALSNHGFYGVEKPVVQVMKDWISGKPVPEKISK